MPEPFGVLALVPDPWQHIAHTTRHHLLTRLARRVPVVWVEPAVDWRTLLRRRDATTPRSIATTRLTVLPPTPSLTLVQGSSRLRRPAERRRLLRARAMLQKAGARRVVLHLWRPQFAWALELFEHDASCYHIDDEYSFSRAASTGVPGEAELIARVDRVICASRALARRKAHGAREHKFVPNGVDFAAFARACREPEDLARIPRPRVGYVGVVKKQLDLPLLAWLAQHQPRTSFVFVGPIGEIGEDAEHFEQLKRLPNVHLLGPRLLEDLPAYTQHVDANLLCYRIDEYTRYIYPLKLHEYLAAGPPVIASDIEAVRDFAEVVEIARTREQWIEALQRLSDPRLRGQAAVEARRAVARRHDWEVLVDEVTVTLAAALQKAG